MEAYCKQAREIINNKCDNDCWSCTMIIVRNSKEIRKVLWLNNTQEAYRESVINKYEWKVKLVK